MISGRSSTLRRALILLETLGSDEIVAAGGGSVGQLATATGRDKSQISRMLATMADAGFVDRDPLTRRYRLGWQVFALASRAGDQRLLRLATPVLTRLVRETGESSHLSVLRGNHVLTLLTESPPRAVQAISWVGRLVSVATTSSGRVLLLDHDRDQLVDLLGDASWDSGMPNAPRSLDDLFARIQVARAAGCARVDEETEPGLVAVAAPVRDAGERIVAAVNVSAPKFRLEPRLAMTETCVIDAAHELSEQLSRPIAGRPRKEALA